MLNGWYFLLTVLFVLIFTAIDADRMAAVQCIYLIEISNKRKTGEDKIYGNDRRSAYSFQIFNGYK